MRRGLRQKGSITVFSILALSLVLGCLLTLLEGARIYELHRIARLRTELAVEASFANYHTTLWKTYHLLGTNREEMQSLITTSANGGYSEYQYGSNLLLLRVKDVEVEGYTLLTDQEGEAYIHAVSEYMGSHILYETAKAIFNQYEAIKNIMESNTSDGTEIDQALKSLEDMETSKRMQKTGTTDNPLKKVQQLQKTQVLELVVKDTNTLSELECDMSNAVSKRELLSGINSQVEEITWVDRVLLQQYLLTYLADYTNPATDRGLAYELEYLIGGKDNDIQNLREVVNQLLLIREAANLVYLLADGQRMEQAYLLATTLAGISANPLIIEMVKAGLLLAWAYGESILDVRALLEGKKIPLIKSKDSWTLALENIGNLSQEYMTAKESRYGISYKSYLGILLLFRTNKELAYRAMDVQELTLQKAVGDIQMDQLVICSQVRISYQYAPVFDSLTEVEGFQKWKSCITSVADYGYY